MLDPAKAREEGCVIWRGEHRAIWRYTLNGSLFRIPRGKEAIDWGTIINFQETPLSRARYDRAAPIRDRLNSLLELYLKLATSRATEPDTRGKT